METPGAARPAPYTPPAGAGSMRRMNIGNTGGGTSCLWLCRRTGGAVGRHLSSKLKVLLAGQLLSFLLAASSAAQATLWLDCHLDAPMFTVGLFYCALALLLFVDSGQDHPESRIPPPTSPSSDGIHHCRLPTSASNSFNEDSDRISEEEEDDNTLDSQPPVTKWSSFWRKSKTYFPMAVLDLYANYVVMRGFEYTTLTSVTLLDALAIPSALLLSKLCLRRQYTRLHFIGVGLCLGGILVNVAQDYTVDTKAPDSLVVQEYPHMMLGDSLAIVGGLLVGASNVVQEVSVRTIGGPWEYLGMLGFWASVIATVHCGLFERAEIAAFFAKSGDQATTRWILAAYFVSTVALYIGTARFLQVSEATFYNLSLLTGDVWSVVFSVAAQGILPQPLFFLALAGTVGGVIVYEMAPSPVIEDHEIKKPTSHIELGPMDGFKDDIEPGITSNNGYDENHDLELKAVIC